MFDSNAAPQSASSIVSAVLPLSQFPNPGGSGAVMFVDRRVADFESLIAGTTAEVFVLDETQDGIAQISQVLAGRRDLSAIHIISHGSAGDLLLGRSGVNLGSLGEYEAALVGWKASLTEDADILLYGCEVGQGSTGLAFVQRLAEVTGADVAASDDLTGNTALGGDWDLEVQTGTIESLAHRLTIQSYQAVLGGSDAFSTRTVLIGGVVSDTGSNVSATAEIGEPDHARLSSPNKSVWWTWTAPSSGRVEVNTLGSNFDTTLAVYAGSAVNSLSEIGSNDDSSYGLSSQVIFSAMAGSRYQIAVSGFLGAIGSIGLNISSTNTGVTAGITPVENSLTNGTFTFTINNPSPNPITINYSLDGSATQGSDYTLTAGTNITSLGTSSFVLAREATSATLNVVVINDNLPEPDELVRLMIGGGLGYTVNAANFSTLTIAANDNNSSPNLIISGTVPVYTENAQPILIVDSATVTDTDSPNFDTGTLTVSYTAGGSSSDRLAIRNQGTGAGQISLNGLQVLYEGTQIGTYTGGVGIDGLVFSFNVNATPTATQALLRNLTYTNVSEEPSTVPRTVQLVLTDGDGGTSTAVTTTINVTSSNDAPVLDNSGAPTLTTIAEDITSAANTGTKVSDLISGLITDTDGDPKAIAITGADRTNGTWDYSTNGGTSWTAIASTSDSNATLLGATSFYTATLGTAPSAQSWLSYTALNIPVSGTPTPAASTETASTAGALVDTTANPRIYAGYSNYNTSNALVNPNSPSLSNTQGYSISFDLQVLADSNTNTSRAGFSVLLVSQDTTQAIELGFQRLSATTGNIFAQDASFVAAEAIAYDTNIKTDYRVEVLGTTYKLFANNSQILTGNLRNYNFTPPANFPFNPYTKSNLIFLGDDTTSAQGTFNLNQVVVQTDNRVRFVPNANYNGSANISFRAWDTTDGKAAGTIANTSINGGTTAFSSAVETATITISAVNDAPTFTPGANQTIAAGSGAQTIANWASFAPGGGTDEASQTATYSITNITNNSLFSVAPTIAPNGTLTYSPAANLTAPGTSTITLQVQDNGGTNPGINTSTTQTFTITVNPQSISLTTSDNAAAETGSDTGTYRVSRTSSGGSQSIQLAIDTTNTATLTNDYGITLSAASITAGVTFSISGSTLTLVLPNAVATADLILTAVDDIAAEAAETVKLTLIASTSYAIGTASGTVTIAQNDFVVINTSDSGEGSLRQAILNANAIAGTDTITFAGPIFTDPTADAITLTTGELAINSDITLTGTGANLLTVSGNNASRVVTTQAEG